MSAADNKFNEEELRRKIREELERKHSERKSKTKETVEQAQPMAQPVNESYFIETYIRRQLEEEVYGAHPEFVKCENHLNQIRWLTPLEMEEEFEFFPVEEGFWERLRNKWFGGPRVKIPDTAEIQQMIDKLRAEFEEDARKRIEAYKAHMQANKKAFADDLEKKIYEEEQDRFYSQLKGYYKYKNHIGETAWMTPEEFENQDEFMERYYTPRQILVRRILTGAAALLVLGGLYAGWQSLQPETPRGYILVETGGVKGSLYIDQNLAVGFSPGVPYPVGEGRHELTVLASGYTTSPDSLEIEVAAEDTVSVAFQLKAMSGKNGVVHVVAPHPEAGLYVDGDFRGVLGDTPYVQLPEGDHTITLKHDYYLPTPGFHTFSLAAGDTVELSFSMRPTRKKESRVSASSLGLIEVNTNVPGARIFLNGRPTGFQTDYVLQKIPFGRHVIRVELENYKAYPKERVVELNKDRRKAQAEFTLSATLRPTVIAVEPQNAPLFLDGKKLAVGRYSGKLPLGKHTITFGDVKGFYTPPAQTIEIRDELENSFNFSYGIRLNLDMTPGNIRDSYGPVRLIPGYIVKGIEFKRSTENAPEVIEMPNGLGRAWQMGFAFQYRNPPGSDALELYFQVPSPLNITKDIVLKLWIYNSREKYPLVIGGKARYRVILNNSVVRDHITVKNDLAAAGENAYETVTLSRYLKPGLNKLIIATADDNTVFLNLWKAAIR